MGLHKQDVDDGIDPIRCGVKRRMMISRKSDRDTGRYIAALLIPALFLAGTMNVASGCRSGKEKDNTMKIQELIEYFREGGEYGGDTSGLIVNGRPDKVVLDRCRGALAVGKDEVRLEVIRLLASLGRKTDPLYEKGGELIRDRSIVSIIVEDGLSRKSEARDLSLDVLQHSVPAEVLRDYGKALADNLKRWPDATLLLVVGKAKPNEAIETVESLMEIPGWAKETETRIAAAALGNAEIEKEFIDRFERETDPKEKANLARLLGFIGTEKALTSLAAAMRTDLVIEMPGVSRRSVRIFIIEALSYNHPEEPILYDNAVRSDEDYATIERFCEKKYNVKWKKERPPFLWIEGFPSERLNE